MANLKIAKPICCVVILLVLALGFLVGWFAKTNLDQGIETRSRDVDSIQRNQLSLNNGMFSVEMSSMFQGSDYEYRIEFVKLDSDRTVVTLKDYGPIWLGRSFSHHDFRLVGTVNTSETPAALGVFSVAWGTAGGWSGEWSEFEIENAEGFGRVFIEAPDAEILTWNDGRVPIVTFISENDDHEFDTSYRLDVVRRAVSD